MLIVSSAKIKDVIEGFDGKNVEGITYHVEKTQGLTANISHNGKTDEDALGVLKRNAKTLPALKNMFLNIRIMDDAGNIY